MSDAKKSKYEVIAERWTDDAHLSRPSERPDFVYHYTDAAGLVGMLASGNVWATDYRFLNDKSEVVHTRNLARSLLTKRLSSCREELCLKLYNEIIRYQDIESTADEFVFSLSEEADDLSQWRGYAREGRGFTIGFDGSAIYDFGESSEEFLFIKVRYAHIEQARPIELALSAMEAQLRLDANEHSATDEIIEDAARWFDWLVENRAVTNKHESFRAEKEWRIVGNITPEMVTEQKVRASGDRLVRYTEIPLAADKLPIKRIGIGPGFTGTEEIHAVRSLCARWGYEPEIYFANTPYRRL